MPASQRPRGEKPQITIRYLQRQIRQMTIWLADLRFAIGEKEKVIAGYDVQVSEMGDELSSLRSRGAECNMRLAEISQQLRQKQERLSYLEGYYYATEKTLGHIYSEANRGASQRDSQDVRDGG